MKRSPFHDGMSESDAATEPLKLGQNGIQLILYIDSRSARSHAAVRHTRTIVAQVDAACTLQIVDLANWDHSEKPLPRIVATPTLVRTCSSGDRHVVGDLSDHAVVLDRLLPDHAPQRTPNTPRLCVIPAR